MTDCGGGRGFDYEMIPGGYYDAVYRRRRGIQSKWHQLKFGRVIEEMEGHYRHLDVGCGPGTLIGLLDDRLLSTGIDISTTEIDYARRVYQSESKRFFAVSARRLPDVCRGYDVVTVVEVIEHLAPAELDDVLRAVIQRLRPGGKLVVTTPNFRSAWPLVQMLISRFGPVDYAPQHINRFTRRRLRRLLQDLGLRDVRVHPYLMLAPFAAPLGWRLADKLARLERGPVERVAGLLLLGTGSKPQDEQRRRGLTADTTARDGGMVQPVAPGEPPLPSPEPPRRLLNALSGAFTPARDRFGSWLSWRTPRAGERTRSGSKSIPRHADASSRRNRRENLSRPPSGGGPGRDAGGDLRRRRRRDPYLKGTVTGPGTGR